MHIGMIGGIGPAATEFYYRNLVAAFRQSTTRLELTIVHADVDELVSNIAKNAPEEQAKVYLDLALRLQAAGADACVISSIAGHFCVPQFEKVTPLPIINIIPELSKEFESRNLSRIGLLGNRVTMESRLFGAISNVEILVPQDSDLDRVHEDYTEMATAGAATDQHRQRLFSIGKSLCEDQGAEAVLLAGTDLFLAFGDHDCGFEAIDGALVHVNAIHRQALSDS